MPATTAPATTTVLVVEDDDLTRDATALTLADAGYHVATAANGQEALDLLHGGLPPDVILLDLMMPVMDGWEFRRRQRLDPALAGIPVVVVSAAAGLEQKAATLGATQLLLKPYESDRLLITIQDATAREQAGVLVADDEAAVRAVLGLALRFHGFNVWLAAGGPEAEELYRRHRGEIDLVLLDVQMPGMDGPWTLAALRQVDPGVRCCFKSGYTGDYTAEQLLELGAVRVFGKPFRLEELAGTLRRLAAKGG